MNMLALLAATVALLAAPVSAAAQAKRVVVLGNEPWAPIDGLRDGLRQLGYLEGKTVQIDYRWSLGRPDQLGILAAELVNTRPDVIVTVGTPAVLAAKKATTTIPIVMGLIGDPVGAGIVANIARPGGNITGVSVLAAELEPKRLEVLKELIPNLSQVTILTNASNPYGALATKHAERGAENLRLMLDVVSVRGAADLEEGLAALARHKPQAVLVPADQFLLTQRVRIAEHMTRHRIPSAYTYREHVEVGGLFSYSTNYHESFRRSAVYVDKIVKGAKPGDLPIEQVDRFDLVLNASTAKALGVAIPPTLLLRVDEVIQ
jgi:putative ABC transport system substrate-binding protein